MKRYSQKRGNLPDHPSRQKMVDKLHQAYLRQEMNAWRREQEESDRFGLTMMTTIIGLSMLGGYLLITWRW